jgi:hypothetical protein
MLEAEWRPDGSLRPLHGEFTRDEPEAPFPEDGARLRRELQKLSQDLRRAAWFRPGSGAVAAMRFPAPTLQDEEKDGCVDRSTDLRLELGPCPAGDAGGGAGEWLATTARLAAVKIERGRADARVRAAVTRLGVRKIVRLEVRRIAGSPALVEARFSGVAAVPATYQDPDTGKDRKVRRIVEGWLLFGTAAEPLASKVEDAPDPDVVLPDGVSLGGGSIGVAAWSLLAADPGVRVAVIPFGEATGGADGSSSAQAGFWIVRVGADGSVRVETLVTEVNAPC